MILRAWRFMLVCWLLGTGGAALAAGKLHLALGGDVMLARQPLGDLDLAGAHRDPAEACIGETTRQVEERPADPTSEVEDGRRAPGDLLVDLVGEEAVDVVGRPVR